MENKKKKYIYIKFGYLNIESNNLLELLEFIYAFGYRKLLEAYIIYTRIYGCKGIKTLSFIQIKNQTKPYWIKL